MMPNYLFFHIIGRAHTCLVCSCHDFQVTSAATLAPNDSIERPTCPICLCQYTIRMCNKIVLINVGNVIAVIVKSDR